MTSPEQWPTSEQVLNFGHQHRAVARELEKFAAMKTPDELGEYLRTLNVHGDRESCYTCPLANHFTSVGLSASVMSRSRAPVLVKASNTYVTLYGPAQMVWTSELPEVVTEFISLYDDSDRYEFLVETYE